MKKQSELVEKFCIDIQKATQDVIKLSQSIGTGNDYQELLSFKHFNMAAELGPDGVGNLNSQLGA